MDKRVFVLLVLGINSIIVARRLSIPNRISSAVKLGVGTGTAIIKNAPKFNPLQSPKEISALGKEAILGLPWKVVLDRVNAICSLALTTDNNLSRDTMDKQDYENISMILYDDKENASFALTEMDKLVQHPSFNENAPVVILVTGWMSNRKNSISRVARSIYSAYKCRGDTNFIVLDTSDYISSLYSWSALNTEDVGKIVASAVADLSKHVNASRIHLIGHSLGAQIVGAIGRYFHNFTSRLLPRITGLDPAFPCYNEGEVLSGIGRGDAAFVDIIHTNSHGFGIKEPIGDADFYPNGVKVLMPGCFDIGCAHNRAVDYYIESTLPGNENSFPATRCNSMKSYKQKKCNSTTIPMGYATPPTAKGKYFLQTNAKRPYGKNSIENITCKSI
ncbi:phospholipase A1-like [Sergentomyia squamirostris]